MRDNALLTANKITIFPNFSSPSIAQNYANRCTIFPISAITKTFLIFSTLNNLFFIFSWKINARIDVFFSLALLVWRMKWKISSAFVLDCLYYAHDKILCDTHSSAVCRKLTTTFLTARAKLNCVARKICLAVYKRFKFICVVVAVTSQIRVVVVSLTLRLRFCRIARCHVCVEHLNLRNQDFII